jgi:hypothetical protein
VRTEFRSFSRDDGFRNLAQNDKKKQAKSVFLILRGQPSRPAQSLTHNGADMVGGVAATRGANPPVRAAGFDN